MNPVRRLFQSRLRPAMLFGSVLGARVVGRVLGALTGILLARVLGPAGFGQLVGAMAVVAIGTPLLQGALDNAALWRLSRGNSTTFLRAVLGAKLWIGIALIGILTLVGIPLSLPLLIGILAVNALVCSLGGVILTWLVARDQQAHAAVAEVSRSVGWLAAAAAVYVAGGGVVAAAATRALASVVVIGGVFFVVRRLADWRPTLKHQGDVLRSSSVFLASGLFFVIYQQADRVMLLSMAGDVEAGRYGVAANLVMVFYMLPGIFTTVFLPRMYRDAGDRSKERRVLEVRLGTGLFLATCIVPLLVGFRVELLTILYGADYAGSAPILLWLAGTILLRFVAIAYGDLITAAERHGQRTLVQAGAAVLNIGLNLVLIPLYGAPGAAAATLASETCLLIGYIVVVRRLGMPIRPKLLVPGALACTGVTAAWLWQPWIGAAALVAFAGATGYGVRRTLAS